MQNSFTEKYKQADKSKKLSFLNQLLKKDTTLQQQFLEFIKGRTVDEITGVDIEDIRKRIYNELIEIDIDTIFEGRMESYYEYDDEMDGDEFIEEVITPYYNEVKEYLEKGDSINAFRQMLSIYELSKLDIPEVSDNYCIFGDGFDIAVYYFVSTYPYKFSLHLEKMVLSLESKKMLLELLFNRHKLLEYNLNHFQSLIISLVDDSQMAHYLLDILEENGLYSVNLALVLLQISTLLDDDKLFLKVANEFYLEDKEVGHQLLKRHKTKQDNLAFANVAGMLLEKKGSIYAPYIIENLDKEVYQTLYIKALKIYLDTEFSMPHYKILREYLTPSERLEFIDSFKKGYTTSVAFYIDVLELEGEYETILNFANANSDFYELPKVLKPIVSIYPNEVFEIIQKNCDKLVKERGRSSYAKASELLRLMLGVEAKKEELKLYVNQLYNHRPILPALRDELKRFGLIK